MNGGILIKKVIIITVLTLFCIFLFSSSVSAANWTVNPGPNSIQNAINTANHGDTLNLNAGTYNQCNITVNKNLTITGPKTGGSPTAVIDAQNNWRVFNITNGVTVNLKYLTIINGNASKDTAEQNGGGIYNSGICMVAGSRIIGNTATYGGGIYNDYVCTVIGSTIKSNTATNNGGGIYNYGDCTVTSSTINGNTATNNGGGILTHNTQCIVTGSIINSNTATFGGGIYVDSGDCAVTGSTISSNTAKSNGGGIYAICSQTTVTGSIINTNTANKGGGIYNYVYSCTVTDSRINGNTATSDGGGIYNGNGGICRVTGSTISSNTATNNGGGIYNYDGTCTMTSSTISGNTATSYGGGIYNDVYNCWVTNSTINSNTADYGGGISNFGGTCTVTNSTINSNTADYGGGILNFGTSTVTGSNINSNTATSDGGGISNEGICTVTDSSINSNIASSGGGIYNPGGTCTITGCDFESNKATNDGNAIYNENGDTLTRILHFNRFYDNAPGYEIFCLSGDVDAMFNWWGSNENPSCKVDGVVDTSPWLVLNINTNPSLVGKSVNCNITADLNHDSASSYHNPASGHVIDGIPVSFSTTLGSITSQALTVNGAALAILTGDLESGSADVFASLDDEIVYTLVDIDSIAPTVSITDPANNAVNVPTNKIITVTFSEPIKAGTNWIELKTSGGTVVPITTSITGSVLTINHASLLAIGTTYNIFLHTDSIRDLAGNSLVGVIKNFTTSTDTTAPTITSIDPIHNAVNVARDKTITVTFSEPIKWGTGWIELKANDSTVIPITASISGSTLTINHASLLAAGTTYNIILHTDCIRDLTGNSLAGIIKSFTTSNDIIAPTITTTDPANNAINVSRDKTITITFNELIKWGNGWIELKANDSTVIPITTSISGSTLTINHASLLAAGTTYNVILHTDCIRDLAGNSLSGVIRSFTTGT